MKPKLFLLLSVLCHISYQLSYFPCPKRCQCYEDNEQRSQVHLICKWDQLNSDHLKALARPDLVRTLTIRCPYHSRKPSIPMPGMFQEFRNLDRLEIDRCLVKSIPNTLFAGLAQLYSLIIRNANISDLPRDVFAYCPKLMTLDLSGNQLRIEPYSIKSLENLIHLDLSDNQISFLTNTLMGLTNLRVVTMNNNLISNIDFRRFPENLTDLSLRENQLSNIHYYPPSARFLKRLDLAGNRLEFVAAQSTGSLNVLPEQLKHVDLSSNQISSLHDSALKHLEHLVLLDLKNNSIKEAKLSSFRGSTNKLNLFISRNPLLCHCMHKWMMSAAKYNISVNDMDAVQCRSMLSENEHRMISMNVAIQNNLLLCKYANMCEANCKCCNESKCECRFECPPECQCLRSFDTTNAKTSQNILKCDNLRIDKLSRFPSPLTQLRLTKPKWNQLSLEPLKQLGRLYRLMISHTQMTEQEIEKLEEMVDLTHIELSDVEMKKLPKWVAKMDRLTHLYIQENPLKELGTSDLMDLEKLKKIKIGGNFTQFTCDCESPTDFQRWLLKKTNSVKVHDIDNIYCVTKDYGTIPIIDGSPGSNSSVCAEPSEETKEWMEFVDVTKQRIIQRAENATSTSTTASTTTTTSTTTMETLVVMVERKETVKNILMNLPPTELPATTIRPRRKYKDYDDGETHKIVNALIFILFICVIILIISIGVTVYYKFLRPEKEIKRKKSSVRSQRNPH